MSTLDQLPAKETAGQPPPIQPGRPYWVQCQGYRCLAILSQDGKWKCFSTGNELTDEVIEVYASD